VNGPGQRDSRPALRPASIQAELTPAPDDAIFDLFLVSQIKPARR